MEEHEIFLILFGIFQENKHVNMAQNGLNMRRLLPVQKSAENLLKQKFINTSTTPEGNAIKNAFYIIAKHHQIGLFFLK